MSVVYYLSMDNSLLIEYFFLISSVPPHTCTNGQTAWTSDSVYTNNSTVNTARLEFGSRGRNIFSAGYIESEATCCHDRPNEGFKLINNCYLNALVTLFTMKSTPMYLPIISYTTPSLCKKKYLMGSIYSGFCPNTTLLRESVNVIVHNRTKQKVTYTVT